MDKIDNLDVSKFTQNSEFLEIEAQLKKLGYMLLFAAIDEYNNISFHAVPWMDDAPTIEIKNNKVVINLNYNGSVSSEKALSIANGLDAALDVSNYLEEIIKNKEIFKLGRID